MDEKSQEKQLAQKDWHQKGTLFFIKKAEDKKAPKEKPREMNMLSRI